MILVRHKEIFQIINLRVRDPINTKMEAVMKEIIKMEKEIDKEYLSLKIISMRVNGKMI